MTTFLSFDHFFDQRIHHYKYFVIKNSQNTTTKSFLVRSNLINKFSKQILTNKFKGTAWTSRIRFLRIKIIRRWEWSAKKSWRPYFGDRSRVPHVQIFSSLNVKIPQLSIKNGPVTSSSPVLPETPCNRQDPFYLPK